MSTAETELTSNGIRQAETKRADYRRRSTYATPRRSAYKQATIEKKQDYREVILAQSMVCGLILFFVLVVCLVDVPFLNDIRKDLKTAISSTVSIDGFLETTKEATDKMVNMQNSVKTIFGQEATDVFDTAENFTDNNAPLVVDVPVTTVNPSVPNIVLEQNKLSEETSKTQATTEVQSNGATEKTSSRIDEDILESINARIDNYGANEKKLQVPVETMPEQPVH